MLEIIQFWVTLQINLIVRKCSLCFNASIWVIYNCERIGLSSTNLLWLPAQSLLLILPCLSSLKQSELSTLVARWCPLPLWWLVLVFHVNGGSSPGHIVGIEGLVPPILQPHHCRHAHWLHVYYRRKNLKNYPLNNPQDYIMVEPHGFFPHSR